MIPSGIKAISYDDVEDTTFEVTIKNTKTGKSVSNTLSMNTFKKTTYWLLGFNYIVCNVEELIKKPKT